MFCSFCGTLGYLKPDGVLDCSKCGSLNSNPTELKLISGKRVDLNKPLISTTKSESRSYEVIEKLHLPTSKSYACPNCTGRAAICELRQMDQTDEPEVAFLECQLCGYGWRQ